MFFGSFLCEFHMIIIQIPALSFEMQCLVLFTAFVTDVKTASIVLTSAFTVFKITEL
jgi:hypothetical protein